MVYIICGHGGARISGKDSQINQLNCTDHLIHKSHVGPSNTTAIRAVTRLAKNLY